MAARCSGHSHQFGSLFLSVAYRDQERRGDDRYPEVFERYADDPRFAQLMGERYLMVGEEGRISPMPRVIRWYFD